MIYLFFTGYIDLFISSADAASFFDLCLLCGVGPKSQERDKKNGNIICRFSRGAARELLPLAQRRGLSVRVVQMSGLPVLLSRLFRSPATLAGILVAVFLFVSAQLFLWDIEITGQEALSEEEVEATLATAGLFRGCFLPRLNTDAVAIGVRQLDERIAYVAVNLTGAVATVQIREVEPEPRVPSHEPANLIARCDGIVMLPLIFEGQCLVEAGQAVRAGQILASGILDTDNNGIRLTRAAGSVMARTEQIYTVTVPFFYLEKSYTGKEWHEVEISFFNLEGKVFKNTGNMAKTCDIIKNDKEFVVGARTLPFGVSHITYRAFEWVQARRTGAQALAQAKEELAAILAEASSQRTLLEREIQTVVGTDGVTLHCTAVFEEDIAIVTEFFVKE